MRVGFDAKRAFHNFVGLGNYARTLIEGLLKYYPDNNYILYTPKFNDPRAQEWPKKFATPPEIRIPRGPIGAISSSLWRSLLLSKVIKKDSLDVFHGLSHELPPHIEKLNIKKVVTIHDLIFLRYPEYFSRIDRYIFQKKFTYSCQVADLVVAISEQTKKDIIEFLKVPEEKVEVVYQSCNPLFYDQISKEEREKVRKKYFLPHKYILYVGSFTKRKNLLTMVKAFAISQKNNDIPLVLVGQGEEIKKQIIDLARNLKVEKKIIFLHNVPTIHLPSVYQGATLFCYPSHFEGFGIPIIEALFSKIPVVTSNGHCFQEAGGPGSRYIDPNDHQAMGQAMIEIIESDSLRQRMVQEGQTFVQKFHYQNTVQKMMLAYSRLLHH
ncbi:MAG: glycosyltransferase family 1 protein [Pseudomonadota bacterium]